MFAVFVCEKVAVFFLLKAVALGNQVDYLPADYRNVGMLFLKGSDDDDRC
jgi:hypothetical protein